MWICWNLYRYKRSLKYSFFFVSFIKMNYYIKIILRYVRVEEMGEFRFSPFFLPLTTPTFLPTCNRPLHGASFVRSLRFFQVFKGWVLFKNNYKFKFIIREKIVWTLVSYFFSFNELWIYLFWAFIFIIFG